MTKLGERLSESEVPIMWRKIDRWQALNVVKTPKLQSKQPTFKL